MGDVSDDSDGDDAKKEKAVVKKLREGSGRPNRGTPARKSMCVDRERTFLAARKDIPHCRKTHVVAAGPAVLAKQPQQRAKPLQLPRAKKKIRGSAFSDDGHESPCPEKTVATSTEAASSSQQTEGVSKVASELASFLSTGIHGGLQPGNASKAASEAEPLSE